MNAELFERKYKKKNKLLKFFGSLDFVYAFLWVLFTMIHYRNDDLNEKTLVLLILIITTIVGHAIYMLKIANSMSVIDYVDIEKIALRHRTFCFFMALVFRVIAIVWMFILYCFVFEDYVIFFISFCLHVFWGIFTIFLSGNYRYGICFTDGINVYYIDFLNHIKKQPQFRVDDDSHNIITKKRIERYQSLSDELKTRIDQLKVELPKKYLIQKQKTEKIYPKIGSVFNVVSVDGRSVNGMVINNHINGRLGKDIIAIVLLKQSFENLGKTEVSVDDLLSEPLMVNADLWKNGYANTVHGLQGHINFEYCFYDSASDNFKDEYGNIKKVDSDVVGMYGMATKYGLSRYVQSELTINYEINTKSGL
jgi:hypothetical protein